MDRFEVHKKSEKDKEAFEKKRQEYIQEKEKLRESIDQEIKLTGTLELQELWRKYTINSLMESLGVVIQSMLIANHGNFMEKMFAHQNLLCQTCKQGLVPDGIYEGQQGTIRQDFQAIPNQYVCLSCGSKFKLQKI